MTEHDQNGYQRAAIALFTSAGAGVWAIGIHSIGSAQAQIVPDSTLGTESSRVVGDRINTLDSDRIDGGAIRGENLFHSFLEFSIDEGRGAYFSNPGGISNILSRVTGSNRSDILGRLGVLGDANLFLLNPNGIVFGPNSSLDIRGSFVASTADRFTLGDGNYFSAVNPEGAPMLEVSVPIGLQYGAGRSGAIINAGDLAVDPGENLTLIGETVINTGTLTAPGGEVSVASISGSLSEPLSGTTSGTTNIQLGEQGQIVEITSLADLQLPDRPDAQSVPEILASTDADLGLALTEAGQVMVAASGTVIPTESGDTLLVGGLDAANLEAGQVGGRVQVLGDRTALMDSAQIDVSGDAGGGVALIGGDYQGQGSVLNAQRTYIAPDVTINADALTVGDGGRVIAWADEITGFYGTITARGGREVGDGGFVEVSGLQRLIFEGNANLGAVNGIAGTLLLDPTDIIIADGSSAANDDQLDGDVPIAGDPLGQILGEEAGVTFTISENKLESLDGTANVILQATNNIILQDLTDNTLSFQAGNGTISFTANSDGVDGGDVIMNAGDSIQTNGRNIIIEGNNLTLGSVVSSNRNDLSSPAGRINLTANNGNITASQITSANITSFGNAGNGGNITLRANEGSINVQRGILTSSQTVLGSAAGNAGDIELNARNDIIIGQTNTPISGSIGSWRTNNLALDASTITVDFSRNSIEVGGDGGDINLITSNGSIQLGGSIFTDGNTDGNTGRNVTLNALNGSISTDYGIATRGGNITINAQNDIKIGDTSPTSSLNTSFLVNSSNPPQRTGNIQLTAEQGNVTVDAGVFTNFQNDGGNAGESGIIVINAGDSISVGENPRGGSRLGVQTASLSQNGTSSTSGSITLLADNNITVASPGLFSGNDPGGNGSVSAESLGQLGAGITGDITIRSINGTVRLDTGVATSSTSEAGNASNSGNITIEAGQDIRIGNNPGTTNPSRRGVQTISRSDPGSAGSAGVITLDAGGNLTIENGAISSEVAGIAGTGNAGNVILFSQSPIVLDDNQISSSTRGNGVGGDIRIEAPSLSLLNGSTLLADTFGTGNAGRISITIPDASDGSDRILLADNSTITTRSRIDATGQGGTIEITAGSIDLQSGSSIDAGSSGTNLVPGSFAARGGDINLTSRGGIQLTGNSRLSAQTEFAGLGGNITLNSEFLLLQENSELDASIGGAGAGGDITITTTGSNTFVTDAETGAIALPDTLNTQTENFGIFLDNSTISTVVEAGATAPSGNITVNTESLALRNGARIQAQTRGSGNAGDVVLTTQRLDIRGTSPLGRNSGVAVSSETPVSGAGGNITINSAASPQGSVVIANNGFLSALTRSDTANAGNIEVNAETLTLQQGGQVVTTSTTLANAGSININAATEVQLSGQGTNVEVIEFISDSPFTGNNTPIPLIFGTTADVGLQEVFDGATFASRPNEAGTGTFAYFSFQVTEGNSRGVFDIDNTDNGTSFTDTELFLFDQNSGTLLASNDDSLITSGAGGSNSPFDSLIDFTFPESGFYVVGVGRFDSFATDGALISGNAPLVGQSYDLRVSLQNADDGVERIPAPESNFNPNPNVGLSSGLFAEATNGGSAGIITVSTPELALSNNATIAVSSLNGDGRAGDVTINAETVTLESGAAIAAETDAGGIDNPANIALQNVDQLTINNSRISSSTVSGVAGEIRVDASEFITLDGISSATGDGGIIAEATDGGNAGNVTLTTPTLTVRDGARIATDIAGDDPNALAGDVTLQGVNTLDIQGGEISTSNVSSFDGGDVVIRGLETLNLTNGRIGTETSTGRAGDVLINPGDRTASSVTVRGETGLISASATGDGGNAGTVAIATQNLQVLNGGQIRASNFSGISQDITLTGLENLEIEDGRIFASTNQGTAGSITINVGENETPATTIRLSGELLDSTGQTIPAGISTDASGMNGNPGSITLRAADVDISRGAEISASSQSGTVGGTITLRAVDGLTLNNGRITTETQAGIAGDIQILTRQGQVNLVNDAALLAEATGEGGDAGNISLEQLASLEIDNASISVSTQTGTAGNVTIDAQNFIHVRGRANDGDREGIFLETNGGTAGSITLTTPDLTLRSGAEISATTSGDNPAIPGDNTIPFGAITINARDITLIGRETGIFSETLGADRAGNIIVQPDRGAVLTVTFREGAEISASTRGTGNGGNLVLNSERVLQLRGDGFVTVSSEGDGDAGTLEINTRQFSLANNVRLKAESILSNGGAVEFISDDSDDVNNGRFTLRNAPIIASSDLNSAGGIIIQVSDRILLSGTYQDEETGEIRPAGLFATSQNGQGGLLTLSAPEIIIRDGAQANASTASGVGGVVSIDGDTLTIRSRSDTPTDTGIFASAMTGTGGDIVIGNLEAFESIRLLGPRSQIAAQATELDGNSGSVTMTVRDLTLQDGAQLTTENESGLTVLTDENSDDPPGISLLGLDQLLLTTGGRVSSQTQTGEAGVIEIEAPNGWVVLRDPGTEISARANDEGGTAGNVSITAQTAILRNQAQVTASNISGRSGDVRFTGLDSLRVLDGASITASTEVGIAGNLSVNEGDRPVDQILVSRGSRLAVEATGLDDDAPTDNALSLSLLAAAETDSTEAIATAGNLTLNTRQLTVESGSELTVRSLLGRAGNLTVNTNALTLNNGDLSASTAADGENGANIFLNLGQGAFLAGRNRIEGSLFLQNESLVEANASRGATGGNITISAPDGYIISTLPSGDSGSDITANADVGNGGSIRIDALGLLGIAFRNQLTPFNDITAISLDGGLPGFVDINTLGIDPSRGLADLPDVVATAPPLDAVCGEGTGFGASRFVTAGRGGLPTDPGDVLPGGVTSSSWVTRGLGVSASLLEEDATVDEASVQGSDPAIGLTEAQGWSVSPGGSVTLASVTQTAIPLPSARRGHHLCGRSPTPPH